MNRAMGPLARRALPALTALTALLPATALAAPPVVRELRPSPLAAGQALRVPGREPAARFGPDAGASSVRVLNSSADGTAPTAGSSGSTR